jgi:hypothetical protein
LCPSAGRGIMMLSQKAPPSYHRASDSPLLQGFGGSNLKLTPRLYTLEDVDSMAQT